MKDFKKLLIWSKGMEITRESYNLVSSWPSFEKFNLGNQIIRAAISIPSNIAEGNSRRSEKDKKDLSKSHWDLLLNWKHKF